MTAEEAVKLVENGDHIYLQGSTSVPYRLEKALADRGHELKGHNNLYRIQYHKGGFTIVPS